MKTKIGFILLGMAVSAIILTTPALADHRGDDRHGGYHHGGPVVVYRHDYYHHDYFGWPFATVAALCILYPDRCAPHRVIVEPAPVVIVQQTAPQVMDTVNIPVNSEISNYSGSWWNGLSKSNQLKFVSAYVREHKAGDPASFSGKSYDDFIKALDVLYQDTQNQALTIDMGMDVVTLKMNGYSDFADCLNGYYIMTGSPNLFKSDAVNAKYDECSKLPQPAPQAQPAEQQKAK